MMRIAQKRTPPTIPLLLNVNFVATAMLTSGRCLATARDTDTDTHTHSNDLKWKQTN
jgi:hypothetical protein